MGKCRFLANASFGLAFWAFFHGKGVFLSFVGLLSSATSGSSKTCQYLTTTGLAFLASERLKK